VVHPDVDASGLAANNLIISAQVLNGTLNKGGLGALTLSSATSTFTGGVNLNAGSQCIIGANDTLATGLKTGGRSLVLARSRRFRPQAHRRQHHDLQPGHAGEQQPHHQRHLLEQPSP